MNEYEVKGTIMYISNRLYAVVGNLGIDGGRVAYAIQKNECVKTDPIIKDYEWRLFQYGFHRTELFEEVIKNICQEKQLPKKAHTSEGAIFAKRVYELGQERRKSLESMLGLQIRFKINEELKQKQFELEQKTNKD